MRLFYSCIILCFCVSSSYSQDGFGEKQKEDTLIDVSELKAVSKKFNTQIQKRQQSKSPLDFNSAKNNAKQTGVTPSLMSVVAVDKQGRPGFIKIFPGKGTDANAKNGYSFTPVFHQLRQLLALSDKHSFAIKTSTLQRLKVEERYNDVAIYGTELIMHLNEAGQPVSVNGQWREVRQVKNNVRVSENDALGIAVSYLKAKNVYSDIPEAIKMKYHLHEPYINLVVYEHEGEDLYAYEVHMKANLLQEWTLLIDASSAEVLEAFDHTCDVDGPVTTNSIDLNGVSREITTYLEGSTYFLQDITKPMFDESDSSGVIYTRDAEGSTGTRAVDITSGDNTWSATATSAHYNAGIAYDYYHNAHGRSSIDGEGGDIYSVVNIKDGNGNDVDNAYWSSPLMVYGNGDEAFDPLAKGLDVAGHEMTHGVIESEANLVYQGESGAINESYADIFGAMIDSANWTIGEEVVKPSFFPSGALRDLEDPHNGGTAFGDPGWQPSHTDEQYVGSADNGGVHINSGIPNHAFYLLATDIGREKAAEVFYHALTNYLTRFSKFVDLRIAVVQSSVDLYGDNSVEQQAIEAAFDAVGILEGEPTQVTTTIPINPGEEQLLFVDQDFSTDTTIYQSDFDVLNPLTETPVSNRPSVSDNGELMAFIGEDHRLYLIDISDPTNPVQTTYFSEPVYSSVSLSKDGSKVALTTIDQDTAIYVHHFSKNETVKFELYNPTYSEGITGAGVLYADALEWDYTGENLIYDAFNRVENDNGEDLEFWDVGIIDVWDNEADDFGSGEIEKIFVGLEEGESIGNPILSKNSPYIMALDYSLETDTDVTFVILGYNFETDELGFIFENNYISWPSYSRADDYLMFSYVQGSSGGQLIFGSAIISLAPDKVNAGGGAFAFVDFAKYAMVYSLGERDVVLSTDNEEIEKGNVKVYPNPAESYLTIEGGESGEATLYDVTGKQVAEYKSLEKYSTLSLDGVGTGLYVLTVSAKEGIQTFKIIVE